MDNIYNKTKGHNITTNCKIYMSGDKLPPAISPICSQHLSERKQRAATEHLMDQRIGESPNSQQLFIELPNFKNRRQLWRNLAHSNSSRHKPSRGEFASLVCWGSLPGQGPPYEGKILVVESKLSGIRIIEMKERKSSR